MKKEFPKKEKVYLVGTHHYCFREGEPSEIIGVKMGQPDKKAKPRLVYEVEYSDGMIDEVCVSEIGINYKIISFDEIKSGIFNNVDLGNVRISLPSEITDLLIKEAFASWGENGVSFGLSDEEGKRLERYLIDNKLGGYDA